MTVVLDVWGGERNIDHLARRVLPIDDALIRARAELERGFLVNLRRDNAWGPQDDFDLRN